MNGETKQRICDRRQKRLLAAEKIYREQLQAARDDCAAIGASPEMLHAVDQHIEATKTQMHAAHNALEAAAVSGGAQPLSGGTGKGGSGGGEGGGG